MRRALWQYLFAPAFWAMPGWMSFGKVLMLRFWGARLGKHVLIKQGVSVLMPWNLRIGSVVAIGNGVRLYNFALIEIGSQVVVSQRVFLCTGSHDFTKVNMPLIYKNISIEDDAWIAAEAFLGSGIIVGQGAVVGARSVVVNDVPPWTVVAGNPAHLIKRRVLDEGRR